jgi:hypothetical protein
VKWIRGGSEGWNWWFDLATGHEIALVLDGGWKMVKNGRPYDARFRVFFYDGVGRVVELTEALLGTDGKAGRLDPEATGFGRYENAERESVRLVEEALEV